MKEIKLTRNQITLVDNECYEELSNYKWTALKTKHTYYAVRVVNKKIVLMHRMILNAISGEDVDHIDHNGLNNQKENLRKCTTSENMMNSSKRSPASSSYKGVCFIKSDNKWRARIMFNYKHYSLGRFDAPMGLAWAKLFCHHKFVEVQKMEILNKEGNVVEIKTLHLCT